MDQITDTQPHMAEQPGLRGHSYSPETNLMRRFRVDIKLPAGKGWLGYSSATTIPEAEDIVSVIPGPTTVRIVDQHNYSPTEGAESVYTEVER